MLLLFLHLPARAAGRLLPATLIWDFPSQHEMDSDGWGRLGLSICPCSPPRAHPDRQGGRAFLLLQSKAGARPAPGLPGGPNGYRGQHECRGLLPDTWATRQGAQEMNISVFRQWKANVVPWKVTPHVWHGCAEGRGLRSPSRGSRTHRPQVLWWASPGVAYLLAFPGGHFLSPSVPGLGWTTWQIERFAVTPAWGREEH